LKSLRKSLPSPPAAPEPSLGRAAAPAQLGSSARQQTQRQTIAATFGPMQMARGALEVPIDLSAVPEPFRPMAQALARAVRDGVLTLSAAQGVALVRLLVTLVQELANPPAPNLAPVANAPMMLSTAISRILGTVATPFLGGVDVELPADFFVRHPLDVTGLDGGGAPQGAAPQGQGPQASAQSGAPALEGGSGLPDLASFLEGLRRGEVPAFDFSRLQAWMQAPAPRPKATLALPAPQRDDDPHQLVLAQPPALRQLMHHLWLYPNIRPETAWLYFQLGFNLPATQALVPLLAAHPGMAVAQAMVWALQSPAGTLPATLALVPTLAANPMNQAQVQKAMQVYTASGGQLPNVVTWINRGMKVVLPAVPPVPGRALAGYAAVGGGAHPPLHPLGADAAVWVAYSQGRAKLDTAKQAAVANAAAHNHNTWLLIQPDVTTALKTFATHAQSRDLLVKTDLNDNRAALVSLAHAADHYSTVPKRARLASLDQFNTPKHNGTVGVLWNAWSGVRTKATGVAKFDYLYDAVGAVEWNANPGVHGQPDATRNPLMLKAGLGAMQAAVLNGLVQNLGTMRAKFNRGPHATNPTGQPGPGGKEYNAVANIAPGGAGWHNNAKQVAPAGVKRFIAHPSGKWFYVPNHYIGPKGWAGPAAYRLIIDAT
jgi:hypothetical protein